MEIRLWLLFDNTQTRTNMHTHSSRSGMAVKHTQAHEDGRARQRNRKTGRKVGESEAAKRVGPRWDGAKGEGRAFSGMISR